MRGAGGRAKTRHEPRQHERALQQCRCEGYAGAHLSRTAGTASRSPACPAGSGRHEKHMRKGGDNSAAQGAGCCDGPFMLRRVPTFRPDRDNKQTPPAQCHEVPTRPTDGKQNCVPRQAAPHLEQVVHPRAHRPVARRRRLGRRRAQQLQAGRPPGAAAVPLGGAARLGGAVRAGGGAGGGARGVARGAPRRRLRCPLLLFQRLADVVQQPVEEFVGVLRGAREMCVKEREREGERERRGQREREGERELVGVLQGGGRGTREMCVPWHGVVWGCRLGAS